MTSYKSKIFILMAAACVSHNAYAASPLTLSSDVFVERVEKLPNGTTKAVLEKPTTVIPGDNLIFVVKYRNAGSKPASNLMVTNPLPKPVQFNGTADGQEEVSVDGGKTWGLLSTLFIKAKDGTEYPAKMSDVTHIRWTLKETLAAGAKGRLIFRGIVR